MWDGVPGLGAAYSLISGLYYGRGVIQLAADTIIVTRSSIRRITSLFPGASFQWHSYLSHDVHFGHAVTH